MTRGWAQKKAAWKTAVATFISINLKPRKFRYFQLPPPKRGTNFPTFSTQGVYLFSSHGQGLYPWNPATFGRKLRWMWVAKRWPSSIDSGRTCTLILFFGNGNGGLMKMVGNSQEAPLCFYVFDPYLYIYVLWFVSELFWCTWRQDFRVLCWQSTSLLWQGALAKTCRFFVATHWKFEFPLQDTSRKNEGWDRLGSHAEKHMIRVVTSQHRGRSFLSQVKQSDTRGSSIDT